jgi:cyclic nucleotide gated channel
VQCLKNEKEYLLQLIYEFLKPLYYNEDSYIIREGEPLNAMLFITQGSVWCFKTSKERMVRALNVLKKASSTEKNF